LREKSQAKHFEKVNPNWSLCRPEGQIRLIERRNHPKYHHQASVKKLLKHDLLILNLILTLSPQCKITI
jgi:hypothetical protein